MAVSNGRTIAGSIISQHSLESETREKLTYIKFLSAKVLDKERIRRSLARLTAYSSDMGYPCYAQLTPVKTRHLPITIT